MGHLAYPGGAPAAAPAPAPTPALDGSALADVLQRLEKPEAAVAKISALEKAGGETQAGVQALATQMQALTTRLNETLQHLPNTLGYRVRETFACASCGAKGFVAAPVMCTHCRPADLGGLVAPSEVEDG